MTEHGPRGSRVDDILATIDAALDDPHQHSPEAHYYGDVAPAMPDLATCWRCEDEPAMPDSPSGLCGGCRTALVDESTAPDIDDPDIPECSDSLALAIREFLAEVGERPEDAEWAAEVRAQLDRQYITGRGTGRPMGILNTTVSVNGHDITQHVRSVEITPGGICGPGDSQPAQVTAEEIYDLFGVTRDGRRPVADSIPIPRVGDMADAVGFVTGRGDPGLARAQLPYRWDGTGWLVEGEHGWERMVPAMVRGYRPPPANVYGARFYDDETVAMPVIPAAALPARTTPADSEDDPWWPVLQAVAAARRIQDPITRIELTPAQYRDIATAQQRPDDPFHLPTWDRVGDNARLFGIPMVVVDTRPYGVIEYRSGRREPIMARATVTPPE